MIKIATNFLEKNGINIKVEDWNGSLGLYDRDKDIIRLNIKKIRKNFSHYRKQIPYIRSINDYIILITCHELGHRDDKQKINSVSEVFNSFVQDENEKLLLVESYRDEVMDTVIERCIEREIAAWKLGSKYVSADRLDDYNLMNEEYIKEEKQKHTEQISELIDFKLKMLDLKIQKELEIELFNKASK